MRLRSGAEECRGWVCCGGPTDIAAWASEGERAGAGCVTLPPVQPKLISPHPGGKPKCEDTAARLMLALAPPYILRGTTAPAQAVAAPPTAFMRREFRRRVSSEPVASRKCVAGL